jgi:hypothetical protein
MLYGEESILQYLVFSPIKATVFVRVARWFVFNPKIPIRVNFGGP